MALKLGTLSISDGDPFKIGVNQIQRVYTGVNLVWENFALTPIVLTATDTIQGQIDISWVPPTEAERYDLYRSDDAVDPLMIDATSPYLDIVVGTFDYYVEATDINGNTIVSNTDSGTGVAPPEPGSVSVDRNTYTSTGTGAGTVVIADGVGTFTPPDGCTDVTVRLSGAGGSGGTFFAIVPSAIGGGYSGTCAKEIIDVSALSSVPLVVGLGGAPVNDDFNGAVGITGGSSSFGDLTVAGGIGGTFVHYGTTAEYSGTGEVVTKCDETHNDGVRWSSPLLTYFGGGGSTFGNGGAGAEDGPLQGETGAGGGSNVGGDGLSSGAGGDGRISISWG